MEIYTKNKLLLLCLVTLTSVISSVAQTGFFTDNKYWICSGLNPRTLNPCLYKITSGKVPESVDGNRVTVTGTEVDESFVPVSDPVIWELDCIEDDGLISVIFDHTDSQSIWPLYDFNVHTGDILELLGGESEDDLKVANCWDYELQGHIRRIISIVTTSDDYAYATWIEGIGSSNLLGITDFPKPYGGDSVDGYGYQYVYEMLKCFEGDECIYSSEDLPDIIASSVNDVKASVTQEGDEYYSLQGIRIAEPRKGEVCIVRSGDGSARKVLF